MTGINCFDTAYNSQFPDDAAAYAGYVNGGVGDQPNYAYITATYPNAHHLSITLFASGDADVLDVEPGAAEPSDIPGWYMRQVARGITRPVIYANAYTMDAEVLTVLAAAGIARAHTRLWTAHYGLGEHICGPGTCGALSIDADGTQWTSNANGLVLDQSLLLDDFFGTPVPVPDWQEAMMQVLPTVRQGSTGGIVRTIQGLCIARGQGALLGTSGDRKDGVDGDYGEGTRKAVVALQKAAGISEDGIVGPQTWQVLVGVA